MTTPTKENDIEILIKLRDDLKNPQINYRNANITTAFSKALSKLSSEVATVLTNTYCPNKEYMIFEFKNIFATLTDKDLKDFVATHSAVVAAAPIVTADPVQQKSVRESARDFLGSMFNARCTMETAPITMVKVPDETKQNSVAERTISVSNNATDDKRDSNSVQMTPRMGNKLS